MRETIDTPVRLGVVGCGRVASTVHLPALRYVPEIEVSALADVDEERLRSTAAEFGVKACYTNLAELLDDAAIDAVAVCVPPQHHTEVALAVLETGKHLFIEKPLALSLEDCDRLLDRAAGLSCKVQVGLNLRQHSFVRQARHVIGSGELGELELLRSSFTSATRHGSELPAWRDLRASGGGVLTEIGTHHFDLWRFLTGREVEQIYVCSRSDDSEDVSAAITAQMSDGTLVSGIVSERTFGNNELEILGVDGRLLLDLYSFDGLDRSSAWEHAGDLKRRVRKLRHTLKALPRGLANQRRGGEFQMTYQRQWQQFTRAILHDGPIDATLEDGRAAVAIATAAIESTRTQKPVEIQHDHSSQRIPNVTGCHTAPVGDPCHSR